MNNQVTIPKELGVKEGLLYKSLMNASEGNLEKRWKLSKTQDLVGKKSTNNMTGEVKVTFDKAKRLDVAFRTDIVGRKAESVAVDKEKKVDENVVTKEMVLKKMVDLDTYGKVIEKKKEVLQMILDEFFK